MSDGFGVENLPFGVAAGLGCVSRIDDSAVSLRALAEAGALDVDLDVVAGACLNPLLGRLEEVRRRLADMVDSGDRRLAGALVPLDELELEAPVAVGDFVDFSASLHHATTMGRLLRPEGDPLPPNWRRAPVAYHGRAGSIVVSGTPVVRPRGQRGAGGCLQATAELDIEAEVGVVVGAGTDLGSSIPIAWAMDHVAGVVLVNDWSARDLQAFESKPLGPFLGKSFATSISPWLVTPDALEPYRVAGPPQDPPPPRYLAPAGYWAYDIRLEVVLNGAVVSRPPFASTYWTVPQLLAHATANGAPTRPGDLFASGAVSGPDAGTQGSLCELTERGRRPLSLPDGTSRSWLHDGDTVTIRGWAGGGDRPLVSLGEVTGTVVPARDPEA